MADATVNVVNGQAVVQPVGADLIAPFAAAATAAATLSQAWAEGTLPGGAGTKSAKEYAQDASGSATGAANSAANVALPEQLRVLSPNLFGPDEQAGALNLWSKSVANTGNDMAVATVNSRPVFRLAATGGVASRVRRIFPASAFASGYISWGAVVEALDAGTTFTMRIIQRDSAGSVLATSTGSSLGAGALSAATTIGETAVALNGSAVTVDLDLQVANTGGSGARTADLSRIIVADGQNNAFRWPTADVRPSLFPDPGLTSIGATSFQAALNDLGELVMTSGAASSVVSYRIPATGHAAPGKILTLTCETNASGTGASVSADISIQAFTASDVEITPRVQANATQANTWHWLRAQLVVPATASYLVYNLTKRSNITSASFRNIQVDAPAATRKPVVAPYSFIKPVKPVIHVDPVAGSDNNTGSLSSPFKSHARGRAFAGKSGKLVLHGGDYTGTLDVTGAQGLEICAYEGERPILRAGVQLGSITKTAGRSNVYQATLPTNLGTPYTPRYRLWVDGTPTLTSLISASDRSALMRGRTYAIEEACEILPLGTSIADVDNRYAADGSLTWYSDGTTIYFAWPSAPTAGSVWVQNYNTSAIYASAGGADELILDGLDVRYGYYNINMSGIRNWLVRGCYAIGARNDNLRYGTGVGETHHIACIGADNDNINGTPVPASDTGTMHSRVEHYSPLAMCAADDGWSDHRLFLSSCHTGLFAFNGDRGAAIALGANARINGGMAVNNGNMRYRTMIGGNFDDGAGLVSISDPPAGTPSTGTTATATGFVSKGNVYNFATFNAQSVLELYQCLSIGATAAGYRANLNAVMRGALNYSQGDATATSAAGGGTVITPIVI